MGNSNDKKDTSELFYKSKDGQLRKARRAESVEEFIEDIEQQDVVQGQENEPKNCPAKDKGNQEEGNGQNKNSSDRNAVVVHHTTFDDSNQSNLTPVG